MQKNRTPNQNGKTPTKPTTVPNDENWKLLKFLCDRIEENKKQTPRSAPTPKQSHPPKPQKKSKRSKAVPITGNLLKRRKKPKHTKSNRRKISTVTNIAPSSYSAEGLHSSRLSHKKNKSALYTSAIHKYQINSPTRTSNAHSKPPSFRVFKAQTPKAGQLTPVRDSDKLPKPPVGLTIEHQKSHSTHLPHKYTHAHQPSHTHNSPSPSSSDLSTEHATASNATVQFQFPDPPNGHSTGNHEYKTQEDLSAEAKSDAQDPLADPVQSLVTFVKRITQIYGKVDDEKQVSDQETIRQVYDKYVEFYHRLPVNPDHLRKFSHKFQDVHITYAAAKQYLDSVQAIESVTSPRTSEVHRQSLEQLRKPSRQSISTPILTAMDSDEAPDGVPVTTNALSANIPQKLLKITLDADDTDIHAHDTTDRENLYAFYKLTDLELLRRIKGKIDDAYHNAGAEQDVASAIMGIWGREYSELEKRLHRQYLNPVNNHKKLTSSLSFNHQQLKRDTTYKSLKQMSEATDIDDQDHDAAVYLLKTYFPDDDEGDQMAYGSDGMNRLLSPSHHSVQRSNIVPSESSNRFPIKPQEQHIRSVTVDKPHKKPTLYRRSTTRSMRHSEALSLYDSMVMRARETKILNKKTRKFRDVPIAALIATKSAPTYETNGGHHPTLGTINSQESGLDDTDEEEDHKLLNMIEDMHGVYHQPFKLEDEEMTLMNEITPEPPLFDAAFRQLTTTSLLDEDSGEEQALSIEQITAASTSLSTNPSVETAITNGGGSGGHTAHTTVTMIPSNLLNIMDKYGDSMESWDFDIFEFMDDPALCGKGLVLCTFYVFRKVGLLDATGVTQANLWRFLENVEQGYLDNPYHNKYHAVDVLLSTHYMFQSSVFKKHMTMWDQFGAYIAAVCHDLGHMGLNNAWYINTAGNLALLYGDDSVLENYHIAETFRILNDSKNNWMLSFPSSVRRYLATVIRRTILATDLKVHGTKMIQLQNMVDAYKNIMKTPRYTNGITKHELDPHAFIANNITLWRCESIATYASLDNIMLDNFPLFVDRENDEWIPDVLVKDLDIADSSSGGGGVAEDDEDPHKPRVPDVDDERIFLLEITIHACDVANPCKPIYIAKEWANRYLKEAFNQGDMERNIGIPVSAGMDRFTSKLPTSQIGFITFVVKRLFQLYSELVNVSQHCLEIMLQNEQYWIQEKKKMITSKKKQNPVSHLGTINE